MFDQIWVHLQPDKVARATALHLNATDKIVPSYSSTDKMSPKRAIILHQTLDRITTQRVVALQTPNRITTQKVIVLHFPIRNQICTYLQTDRIAREIVLYVTTTDKLAPRWTSILQQTSLHLTATDKIVPSYSSTDKMSPKRAIILQQTSDRVDPQGKIVLHQTKRIIVLHRK
jgi:hypothetical protein